VFLSCGTTRYQFKIMLYQGVLRLL
jgi:hypothetical protein